MAYGRNTHDHPVTHDDIRKVFSQFGDIVNITGGNKDFVFIDYSELEACHRAIEGMHDKPFDEHSQGRMKVALADPSRVNRNRDRGPPPRRDDRDLRRRSRSPPGRGGPGYPPRDDTYPGRPRSRSPRGDRRGDMPPYHGDAPYRDRSRERMPETRALGGGAGFRDDMARRDDGRGPPRRDMEQPRESRTYAADGYARADYGPARGGGDGRGNDRGGGGEFVDPGGGRGYDSRPQGGRSYDRDGREYPARHDEPVLGYGRGDGGRMDRDPPRERDDGRRGTAYPLRLDGYDRPASYGAGDGERGGGGYRGDVAYEMSRGGAPYDGRGYDTDPRKAHGDWEPSGRRNRSNSRERSGRMGPGYGSERQPDAYDDRLQREAPRERERGPPPRREDGYGGRQEARGAQYDFDHHPRAPPDAVYPRRDQPVEYYDRPVDSRPAYNARQLDDGREGRMERDTRSQADDYRARSSAYPPSRADGYQAEDRWSRGAGGDARSPQQYNDRMLGSPVVDGRGGGQRYYDSAPQGGGASLQAQHGGTDGRGGFDSLPPTDLRRSLGVGGGGGGGGSVPEAVPQHGADVGGREGDEKISDVEAQRRRQRAERFAAAQVAAEGGGHGSARPVARDDDDDGNM